MDLKKYLSVIQPISKKKYAIAVIVIVVWILFLDQNSVLDQIDDYRQLNKLEDAKNFYRQKIKVDSAQLNQLKTNKNNLEKYAREQYLMKRPNEDVFIIVDEDADRNKK
jgi:cell division protein DivIC